MSLDEARESGATGLFENKYGEKVKVYTIGDFSKEICGGPHVEHTGDMGHFKIIKEEAVSSGIRRIKAILEK
jgi:alanyl-tRNA synthetase